MQAWLVVHRDHSEASSEDDGENDDARLSRAYYHVIASAESLGTGHVRQRSRGGVEVPSCKSRTSGRDGKSVTALAVTCAVGGQVVVNQAAAGRQRNARRRRAAQLGQRAVTVGGISAEVADLTDDDSVLGSSCGRIVGSHTCTHQVRNCNRCDDQDDGNHDQQLNQRKTLIFLHSHSPGRVLFLLNMASKDYTPYALRSLGQRGLLPRGWRLMQ